MTANAGLAMIRGESLLNKDEPLFYVPLVPVIKCSTIAGMTC